MAVPILILAAGQSSRMRGIDKLLEQIDGTALLRRQILAATSLNAVVFVALPSKDHPRHRCLGGTAAQPIIIPQADQGLGITLRHAVAALPPCPAFMVVLADLVDLTASDFQSLLTARSTNPAYKIWRGANAAGQAGHPIIFDQSLRPAFAALTGDTGGAAIITAHQRQTCLVPLPKTHATQDLDTPEDWAQWRKTRHT